MDNLCEQIEIIYLYIIMLSYLAIWQSFHQFCHPHSFYNAAILSDESSIQILLIWLWSSAVTKVLVCRALLSSAVMNDPYLEMNVCCELKVATRCGWLPAPLLGILLLFVLLSLKKLLDVCMLSCD